MDRRQFIKRSFGVIAGISILPKTVIDKDRPLTATEIIKRIEEKQKELKEICEADPRLSGKISIEELEEKGIAYVIEWHNKPWVLIEQKRG